MTATDLSRSRKRGERLRRMRTATAAHLSPAVAAAAKGEEALARGERLHVETELFFADPWLLLPQVVGAAGCAAWLRGHGRGALGKYYSQIAKR